jgi:hypothetical protein
MSNDKDPSNGADTPSPKKSDDDVGYKKPPKATQFKKGKSGNPCGRPKGAKNREIAVGGDELRAIILREARRTISVREGGQMVTYQVAETVVRSLAIDAARGKPNAQKQFLTLYAASEEADRLEALHAFEAAIDYKHRAQRELEFRQHTGTSGPEIIPHPEDVVVDPAAGTVKFKGPIDKKEQEQLEFLLEREEAFEQEAEYFRGKLTKTRNPEKRRSLERDIERSLQTAREMRDLIDIRWSDAHLVIERDKKLWGEDFVRRMRIVGAKIPRDAFPRGFHSPNGALDGEPSSAKAATVDTRE